jgi:hypothetical protein
MARLIALTALVALALPGVPFHADGKASVVAVTKRSNRAWQQ